MAAIDTQEPKAEPSEDPSKLILRASDLIGVLDETKRFYKELNSKLGNIKEYMVQEVETGMFTFEMYLMNELDSKQAELAQLMAQIETQGQAAEDDQLGKSLESEIKWFRVRETILNSNAAKFGNALIETKRKVIDLRKSSGERRMELWKLQEDNKRMSLTTKGAREVVKLKKKPVNAVPEEIVDVLPPLSLLMELSPKSLGSLKIREIHQYRQLKDRLNSAKHRLFQYHGKSHTLTSGLQFSIAPKQDYRQIFHFCFEEYARYTLEMTMPRLAYARSPASTRSSSCELLTEAEVRKRDVANVAAHLASKPDLLRGLVEAVFGVKVRPRHGRVLSLS